MGMNATTSFPLLPPQNQSTLDDALTTLAAQDASWRDLLRAVADAEPGSPLEAELAGATRERDRLARRAGLLALRARGERSSRGTDEIVSESVSASEDGTAEDITVVDGALEQLAPEERAPAEPPPVACGAARSTPEVTDDLIARLQASFDGGSAPAPDPLGDVLDAVGAPSRIRDLDAFSREARHLDTVCARVDDWDAVRPEEQRLLLELVAARLRHLQDEAGPALGHPAPTRTLGRAFGPLLRFSRTRAPGFAHGMARSHAPRGEDWVADASAAFRALSLHAGRRLPRSQQGPERNPERALNQLESVLADLPRDGEATAPGHTQLAAARTAVATCFGAGLASDDQRLVKLLAEHSAVTTPGDGPEPPLPPAHTGRFRAVRRAVRDYLAEDDGDDESSPPSLPDDWPLWGFTRGRAGLLLGGDRRGEAQNRLQHAFGFASLDWERGWNPARTRACAKRVEHGVYDLVILLARFASHSLQDSVIAACKAHGIPWVVVQHGYGVAGVRVAMEAMLRGKLDREPSA